jgi:AhpD family alkylhydroperoxidase
MKYLTLLLLFSSLFLKAQTNDESYNDLLEKSPFNEMYPKYMAQDAADYFTVFNTLFSEKSPIAPKEARLAAIAVSAAIKCEYCVSAQVHLAKQSGANSEEIKAAIQIAAEIQRFSTLLYGNEFGIEKLEKIIGKKKVNKIALEF